MKRLEQAWRWFGPDDPVRLSDIRQAGASGIVTALHHIPIGEVWPMEEILARKEQIEKAGLRWSVVESVPLHDEIKRQAGNWQAHIENYKQTLRHLAACGIFTVTYNFMPVLDWTRTDLEYVVPDGSKALRFDHTALAAFDLFLLKRTGAERDYSPERREAASIYFNGLSETQKEQLTATLIAGLPGTDEGYSLQAMKKAIARYEGMEAAQYRQHLIDFLKAIVPVAEETGIRLAIHPDDPPFSILGLPRVVSTAEDVQALLEAVDSPANGLCFCTGSYGARAGNGLPAMARQFSGRTHFLHLRNVSREPDGSFYESDHLDGEVDMYEVVRIFSEEQQKREEAIPLRPDHGHQMLDDLHKKVNPGYSGIGRLRGLAELRGLEWGILKRNSES